MFLSRRNRGALNATPCFVDPDAPRGQRVKKVRSEAGQSLGSHLRASAEDIDTQEVHTVADPDRCAGGEEEEDRERHVALPDTKKSAWRAILSPTSPSNADSPTPGDTAHTEVCRGIFRA